MIEKFLFDLRAKSGGYPIAVLSRNLRSFLGSSISSVTKGTYNHFMWLINHDTLASQGSLFCKEPITDYMQGQHILKFVIDTRWDFKSRMVLLDAINDDLKKPFYCRMYDYLAIFGQLIHQPWIQIPWIDICSERGKYFKLTDHQYNLKYPDPTDINRYMKLHQATKYNNFLGYKVIDRWIPEDF
jgi:hypothetical protein